MRQGHNQTIPSDRGGLTKLEELVDATRVAALLDCSRQQVYIMAERGLIPSYKIGSLRRFAIEDIKAWLEERRQGRVSA